jgi:hypothetical protein
MQSKLRGGVENCKTTGATIRQFALCTVSKFGYKTNVLQRSIRAKVRHDAQPLPSTGSRILRSFIA